MTHFTRHTTLRNPVWMVPLTLPLVLYASQTYELALLFAITVVTTVPMVHAVSFFVERWLPRHLRIIPVLLTAAVVVTIAELILVRLGQLPSLRTRYLVLSLTVAGITVSPAFSSPPKESFRHRMAVVGGLSVGFVVGLTPLALVRIVLSRTGYIYADSVAVGFFLLALGRMIISAVQRYSGDSSRKEGAA